MLGLGGLPTVFFFIVFPVFSCRLRESNVPSASTDFLFLLCSYLRFLPLREIGMVFGVHQMICDFICFLAETARHAFLMYYNFKTGVLGIVRGHPTSS